jgi:hypothetical protein
MQRIKVDVPPLPPICAWNTFIGVIDFFKASRIPNFVTHEALPTVAEDVRSRVITSLRALRLVGSNGETQDAFRKLVASRGTSQWETDLRFLMANQYQYIQTRTLTEGDSAALRKAFLAYLGRETDNLSKCEAFFLNLARASGIKLSDALQKRVATSDSMATVRAARKDSSSTRPNQAARGGAKKDNAVKPTTKPAMTERERADKIMDLLKMFDGEDLPAEPLHAILTLLDYVKKKAVAA